MPIRIIAFFACLMMTACATSPQGLKEQQPDFEYTARYANLVSLSECILRKMEAYPVLVGFSFEDRTLPVQIRQFSDRAELFQMQNLYIVSLVQLEKLKSQKIQSKLYVTSGLITREETAKAYSGFIKECY